MGLRYGYDEKIGKWYASGLYFRKLYDSEEEMKSDAYDAQIEYFDRLKLMKYFSEAFAYQLRGRQS